MQIHEFQGTHQSKRNLFPINLDNKELSDTADYECVYPSENCLSN